MSSIKPLLSDSTHLSGQNHQVVIPQSIAEALSNMTALDFTRHHNRDKLEIPETLV